MTRCVILQPSYIPWRGYFHLIQKADVFVFYDDVQYDRLGWRNRNRIKTPQGPKWLTIPVYRRGAVTIQKPINQIQICWDKPWNNNHWATIEYAYHKAPFFQQYAPAIKSFYERQPVWLADFTIDLTIAISRELGIQHTKFLRSSSFSVEGRKTDRLINILTNLGATHYISGPSARDYIEADKFDRAGITLEYMEYHYPEYPQLYPPFDPQVTVLDLMFMTGPDACKYIYDRDQAR